MLKINLFIKYYILFLAMAKFKQACFAHDLSKKFHTFYTHVIFGCTRHTQTSLALHSLARKFVRSHTEKIPETVKDVNKKDSNTLDNLKD